MAMTGPDQTSSVSAHWSATGNNHINSREIGTVDARYIERLGCKSKEVNV